MNTPAANRQLLQLFVRVYNLPIQFYYHFPEVIICGPHRLEPEEFTFLVGEGLIAAYHTDSFGKLYRLTTGAEALLKERLIAKPHRRFRRRQPVMQPCLFD